MFSDFGKKLTGESGILQLMEDLGAPLPKGKKICALGGGNPAQIPEELRAVCRHKQTGYRYPHREMGNFSFGR